MTKFNETPAERRGEAVVENKESIAESGESILDRVTKSSEQTVAEGDSVLEKIAESIKPDEVEGGSGLLQVAKQKMSELGERIQGLAASTRDRIKEAIVGRDVEDMTDEELADHLRKKRQEHLEAHQRFGTLRREGKFDLGGFRSGHALDQAEKRKKERAEAAREVKRRGMEVLTPEEEQYKEQSEIRNEYIRLRMEREDIENGRVNNKQRREEINSRLAELEARASKIGYEIPSYVTQKYTPEEQEEREIKERKKIQEGLDRDRQEEARQREEYPHWTDIQERQKKEAEEREARELLEKLKKKQENWYDNL